ncbi:MAG: GrpB family protein [Actinomycetota bacterium]
MLEVIDYDGAWAETFQHLRDRLWPAVKDLAVSIEHVGSTSVPGLAAKPIIDIIIVLSPESTLIQIDERIVKLGYIYEGLSGQGRSAYRHPAGLASHHLFACEPDSPALIHPIAFRDYLREHPSQALKYGELKKRLVREIPGDVRAYTEAKTAFILDTLRMAGLGDDDLDSVRETNKHIHERL